MPGAEFNIQFVDHFCLVGIVTNCLAEQAGLRRAPEIRLMQFYRFGQWPMGGDKAGDRCVIIRQPELGKQVTHFVYRTFHDSILPIFKQPDSQMRSCRLGSGYRESPTQIIDDLARLVHPLRVAGRVGNLQARHFGFAATTHQFAAVFAFLLGIKLFDVE